MVSPADAALVQTLVSLSFGLVVLGLLSSNTVLNRWLSARWLLFLSKISYSLYLVHMVFMEASLRWLDRWLGIDQLGVNAQFGLYLPVFCALSIAAALLLHYLIEKPFLILKDRV